jgi:hypothetical protein
LGTGAVREKSITHLYMGLIILAMSWISSEINFDKNPTRDSALKKYEYA